MTRSYKRWTEEEKQNFFQLLKERYLNEAITLHANKTGRKPKYVRHWYNHNKELGKIPQEVIDSVVTCEWPETEIKELCQSIAEHPHNFMDAYRIHANAYGRTVKAVSTFFERYRRKEEAKICMVTIGKKRRASFNRKNIYPGTGGTVTPVKQSKWKQILKILFG